MQALKQRRKVETKQHTEGKSTENSKEPSSSNTGAASHADGERSRADSDAVEYVHAGEESNSEEGHEDVVESKGDQADGGKEEADIPDSDVEEVS